MSSEPTTNQGERMTFDEYQQAAHATAIYPQEVALAYVTMGLVGEAGEIANKVKKIYRDHGFRDDRMLTSNESAVLSFELSDALWYCAELATVIGVSLGDVAANNIAKLQSRQQRNALGGSGDNR